MNKQCGRLTASDPLVSEITGDHSWGIPMNKQCGRLTTSNPLVSEITGDHSGRDSNEQTVRQAYYVRPTGVRDNWRPQREGFQ